MRSRLVSAARAALMVVALSTTVESASAQNNGRALVYCPVGIDDVGCNAIVNALAPMYLGAIDKGYDGSGGTINLATADLGVYSVFVVPSLADDAGAAPYQVLRDPSIAHRLRDVLLGRIALWSGSPDHGSSNRAEKDGLIRSLTTWTAANFSTVNGPGLVVLLDQSANAIQRYDWLQGLVGLNVLADTEVNVYGSVRTLDAAGAEILTTGGVTVSYANMASFGFYLPVGAPGASLSAVGQTGAPSGGQVVLLTSPGGNVGTAVVTTDKDDYAPGQTVTITGSGFKPGEVITINLHEDPQIHANKTLSATADASGNWVNTAFAPEAHHIGVRFILTATGNAGSVAQTTFTDGNPQTLTLDVPVSVTVSAGGSAGYTARVVMGGNTDPCTVTFSVTTALPAGASASFSPNPFTTTNVNFTSALTITTTSATPTGTYPFTVQAARGSNCQGTGNLTAIGTLIVAAAANTAPVLAPIGNKSVNELATLSFTATATDGQSPPQTLTYSLDAGAPAGALINPTTGAFSWTPTEAQGPGSYPITVRVTDNGSPALDDSETITVTVNEVNVAPVLGAIGPKTANEGSSLTFTAAATDSDLPANTLTFSLDAGAPAGATIDAATGAFSWTPTEAQGPGSFPITVRVTDNGSPMLDDSETITVTVNEVNAAPVLAPIGNKSVNENASLSFTATATDADVPANTLVFSLDAGAPSGAAITAAGAFTWTPTEAQGPGSYPITIRVTDNGVPVMEDFETITVTVNEVNEAPILAAIGNKTVNEGAPLSFTASATDSDVPANTLTYSLDTGAPAGATINATTGVFSWTPSEAQGPGNHTITIRVTDNGTPALDDSETITVTVNEVNAAPVLDPIGNKTVNESASLSFTATATDSDLPANTLVFSLDAGAPAGAAITAGGAFTWTPTEAQGPGTYTITIRVTDNGSPVLDDSETITVTVNEVNEAPVLAAIGNKTLNEETLLTFTATATDPDLPPNTLAFSLVGAPAGATINPATGEFSWTPSEAQGPGTHTFTVKVTDNGTPAMSDEESITVTVNEVNKAPVLGTIGDKSVDEETALTFTAAAVDPDIPANTLTYSLDTGAPAGATINATTGAFSWTPTEAQGPGVYPITIRVTDNGSPVLDDFETINVTVKEVNLPPVLAPIGPKTLNEETLLTFTASATDPDLPPNTLTFSLVGAPAGATINPTTGAFSWTPTEAQGPGAHTFTVKVTDNGSPALSDEEAITVTVNEVNRAPVLATIGNKTVDEETALTFTASAADPDIPANTLTYSLDTGAPAGASISSTTGAFSWTPTEAQGPGTFTITIRVMDNGSPVLDDFETITVTVNEVNKAPVLATIGSKTVDEEATLTFTASASDADLPPNTLTFSLVGAPAGATINATTGAFSWTPTEAQGPQVYTFTVKVMDNGTPNLSDEEEITVTVNEVNRAPVLGAIGNKSIDEETALTFTATATDPDLPPNTLTFSLDAGAPTGATINATTGAFSWTPTETQGPGNYPITIRVTDNGVPVLDDFETISVTVKEVNKAPVLAPIGNKTVDEETPLTFTASATDADIPANTLTYSLDTGAPAGATINPTTGAFSWTPTEAQGPGSYPITIRVTDNGSPVLDDFETITVTVNEVNRAPELGSIGNKTVDEETLLSFNATATDPDLPANTLTFSLDAGAPAGAAITAGGAFTWTPTEGQGPGTYTITIRVTDNGSPVLDDSETITVTVREVNKPPVLDPILNKSVNEGSTLTFIAKATDPDIPANALTFSLVGAPAGATINPATGEFSWTPTDGPSQTATFTVKVTDNGSPAMSDEEQITVTVVNVAPTATFNAPSSVPEGTPIALSLTNPSDPSSNDTAAGFTYAFDCGTGSGYGAYSASNSTTCPTPDNGTRTVRGKIRDKDNGETPYTASVTITNVAPTITSVTAEPTSAGNVYSVDQNVTIKAQFTDLGSADTHTCVATALGLSGATKTGSTGNGTSTSGTCSSTIDFTVADVYTVTITVKDDDLDTDSETIQVVIYDPSAGFVTGGGWIMAAQGSYAPDPSLSGKGTFGFVSKYKRGASVPEGNTQFVFHAAGFNFHSTAYQFLIVNQNGTNAQFKGTGTVNGASGYSFMLWATDESPDKFRIKVWETATNIVVFDNLMGQGDGGIPQAIGGGSIQIQTNK